MARIRIDLDQLATAFSDHDSEWVLDLQTGQVLMADWLTDPEMFGGEDPDDDADEDDREESADPVDPDRYRYVDNVSSHEGFRWMERFAASQDDDRVREQLLDALDRPRPFRRFKDALAAFPAVREAWFRYEEQRLREEIEAWLEAEGIDAELVDVRQSGAEPETEST